MRRFPRALLLTMAAATVLHALTGAPVLSTRAYAAHSGEDDEYNFSWLDPDKKVYVLQNRRYRKAERFALFVSGGINFSNPFRSEYMVVPRMAYWFSEQFGIEAFYSLVDNIQNSTAAALRNRTSVLPFERENRSYYGGLLTWTPWYSKINFFNKILYFDWYFDAGLGQLNTDYDQNTLTTGAANLKYETLLAGFYGTGMDFYVTHNLLVRLDLIGMAYRASAADSQTNTVTTYNYDFTAGVGWAF